MSTFYNLYDDNCLKERGVSPFILVTILLNFRIL